MTAGKDIENDLSAFLFHDWKMYGHALKGANISYYLRNYHTAGHRQHLSESTVRATPIDTNKTGFKWFSALCVRVF